MQCPVCGKELRKGALCAGRSSVVWRPDCGAFTLPPGLTLSPTLRRPAAENGYCPDCGLVFVRPAREAAEEFEEKYRIYCEKKKKREG